DGTGRTLELVPAALGGPGLLDPELDHPSRELEERQRMLLGHPAADLAQRELDHERGRAGDGVVRPARRASRVARELRQRHPPDLGVEALQRNVTAGLVDDTVGLVVPNDEPRRETRE